MKKAPTLKYYGIPWLMVRANTPYKSPSRCCTVKENTRSQPYPIIDRGDTKNGQLPFLPSSKILFSDSEMDELKASIKSEEVESNMYKSPSRLQQIKMRHFDSAQTPFVMDIEKSAPYFIPTSTDKTFQEVADLISPRDVVQEMIPQTVSFRSVDNTSKQQQQIIDEKALTIEELKNQVWIYAHKKSPVDVNRADSYNGQLINDKAKLNVTEGKKRLLQAIFDANNFEKPEKPKVQTKINTERCYTAKRLYHFYESNHLQPPSFLDHGVNVERPRTNMGGY